MQDKRLNPNWNDATRRAATYEFLPLLLRPARLNIQRSFSEDTLAIVLRCVNPAWRRGKRIPRSRLSFVARASGSSPIAKLERGRRRARYYLRREFKRQSREGYFPALPNRYGRVRWLGAESLSKSDILFSIDYVMVGVARPHGASRRREKCRVAG